MSRDHGSAAILDQLAACVLLDAMAPGAPDDQSGLGRRRAELRLQRDVLVGALAHHLPTWTVPVAPGGLSLWCGLPPGLSSTLLADAADPLGLRLATGSRFGAGHAFDDRVRLPFVASPDVLERAVDLMARASMEAVRSGRSPAGGRRDAALLG